MKDIPYEKGKGIGDQIIREAGKKNRSGDWYSGKLRQVLGELQEEDIDLQDTGGIEVGRMYFFVYGANTPKLTFFDRQPLAYITEINYNQNYFIGINLHYVGRQYREGLAKSLINKGRGSIVPKNSLHYYRYNGIGSLYKIPESEDWGSISLLPTERFIGRNGMKYPKHKAWNWRK